jgi:hypothetical protein
MPTGKGRGVCTIAGRSDLAKSLGGTHDTGRGRSSSPGASDMCAARGYLLFVALLDCSHSANPLDFKGTRRAAWRSTARKSETSRTYRSLVQITIAPNTTTPPAIPNTSHSIDLEADPLKIRTRMTNTADHVNNANRHPWLTRSFLVARSPILGTQFLYTRCLYPMCHRRLTATAHAGSKLATL